MIVIDASSLAKYLLREENWEAVEKYLARGARTIDHALKEVSNAIWKHVAVYRRIPVDLGLQVYKALKRLVEEEVVVVEGQDEYMDKAVELALKHRVTVYDSLYIAQALKYGELLTSDKEQARVAREHGVIVHYVE